MSVLILFLYELQFLEVTSPWEEFKQRVVKQGYRSVDLRSNKLTINLRFLTETLKHRMRPPYLWESEMEISNTRLERDGCRLSVR